MIDMPLIYRASALVNSVGQGNPELSGLTALARDAPERIAELAYVLAAALAARTATGASPAGLLADLADSQRALPVDLSAIGREAHRVYVSFQRRGEAVYAPDWVLAGNLIHSRCERQKKAP